MKPPDTAERPQGVSSRTVGLRLGLLMAVAGVLTCDWITGPENQAPTTVGRIPDQVVGVDSTVELELSGYFSDPEGETLTYAAVSGAPETATVTVSGSALTVTGLAAGETMVTVTARDPDGLAATQGFAVTVPNRVPVVADTIPDGEVFVDSLLVLDAAAYFADPDGDELAYTAVSSDTTRATVAVSASTLTVTGMAVGSTTVTVTARDPGGLEVAQGFAVTVPNRAPAAVDAIGDRVIEVDSVSALAVAPYFADPDRDPLEYSAVSADTAGVVVVVAGDTLTLTGVAKGRVSVTVTARDPGGLEAEQHFEVTVPNRMPVAVGAISGREVFVGDGIEIDLAAHFTDPDGDSLAYVAVSSDTTRVVVSVAGGIAAATGVAVGAATVMVTAVDSEGLTAEQEFTVTVPNRAPAVADTIPDGEAFVDGLLVLEATAYFADPDGQELSYTAVSSDTTRATVAVSASTVTVTGMAVGSATVTVTARDPGGLEVAQGFAVTVPNRAPAAVDTIADRVLEVDGVAALAAAPYFADPDRDPLEYSAVSADTAGVVVVVAGDTLTLTGVAKGSVSVTVTARDPGGLEAEQHFEVTVPNRMPVAVGAISGREVFVGDGIEIDLAAHFTDPDGDSLAYVAVSSDTTRVVVSVAGGVAAATGVAVGAATVMVTAVDSEGLTAEQEFAVTVPNRAPAVADTIPDGEVFVDGLLVLEATAYFADPDGQELAYTAVSSDTTRATVAVSASTLTVTGMAVGSTTVSVTARDPGGLAVAQGFAVTVPNRAPAAVDTIADRVLEVDSVAALAVAPYFADPDRDRLEYSAVSADTARVVVVVAGDTLTLTGVAKGRVSVTVTARDPGGLEAEQHLEVTVPNRMPVAVGAISGREVFVGDGIEIDLAAHFTDPDGDSLVYVAVSSDTTRVVVSVAGGVAAATGVAVGAATVMVTAVDSEGLTAEQEFAVTVPNRAPAVADTIPDRDVHVGETVEFDAAGYFTEPDGEVLVYAVESSDPAIATVAVSGSEVSIAALKLGVAAVTVTARDPHGVWAEQRFTVTVPSQAPHTVGEFADREVAVDSVIVVDVAHRFTEPDGEPLEYLAASSDTSRVRVMIAGSELTVTSVAAGSATVTVTARDPGGLEAVQAFVVTVPNRAPAPVGTIDDLVVKADSSIMVDLAAHFTDPDGDALEYAANSSDPTRATAEVSGSLVTITGVAGGSATILITARDPAGLSAEQRFGVTVPNRPPRAVAAIANQTVARNGTTILDLAPYFSDPDGDDLTYSAVSSRQSTATVSVSGTTLTVTGRRTGTVTITVTASDPAALSVTGSFELRVVPFQENRPPDTVSSIGDRLLETGETLSINVSSYFRDPDGDNLNFSASSSRPATATAALSDSTLTVTAAAEGTATITVTATDPGGLTANQRFEVTAQVPGQSDLVVQPPTASPNSLGPGETLTLSVVVQNQGAGDASSGTTLRYYSSVDATINAGDDQVGTDQVPELGASETSAQSITFAAPSAGGTYYYGACADAASNESATANNCSSAVEVVVLVPNRSPSAVGTIPNQSVGVGSSTPVDVEAYFTDPDGDNLAYTATSGDPALVTVAVSGSRVEMTGEASGETTITVRATDPGNLSATQEFTVTATESNLPPTVYTGISDIPDADPNAVYGITLTDIFSDPNGDDLTWSASSSNTNAVSPEIVVDTILLTTGDAGTANIIVTATDPDGLFAADTFTITVKRVNRAPTVHARIADISDAGTNVLYVITLTDYFSDPDGDDLTWSASSSNTNAVSPEIVADTIFLTTGDAGTANIIVTATDPDGLFAADTFTITLRRVNRAPTVHARIGDISDAAPNVVYVITLTDYFSDPDGDDLTWSASSSNTNAVSPEIVVDTILLSTGEAGTANIIVAATDPGGLFAADTFTMTIANRAPTVHTRIGDISDAGTNVVYGFTLTNHFSDPDGDDLTWSASSSNTNAVSPEIVADTILLTTGDAGTANIIVTATDPDGLFAADTFTITLRTVNRAPTVHTRIGDIPDAGTNVVYGFTLTNHFSDPDGDDLTWSASSSNTNAVSPEIVVDTILLTTGDAGTANIIVTATDPDGLFAADTFTITLRTVNRAPTVIQRIGDIPDAAPSVVYVVTLTDYFSDPDGDDLTWSTSSSNTNAVSPEIVVDTILLTTGEAGTANIIVTATDPDGLFAADTFSMTVVNRAPTVHTNVQDFDIFLSEVHSITFTDIFSDPNGDDLTWSASSSNSAVAQSSIVADTIRLTASAVGTANITVTATDPDGLSAADTFAITVKRVNRAPTVHTNVQDFEIFLSERHSITLTDIFSDPDGDDLTWSARSTRNHVQTSIVEDTLRLDSTGRGKATIYVTATDPGNLSAADTFEVNVVRRPDFDIDIVRDASLSSNFMPPIRDARDRWEAALQPTELQDINYIITVTCGDFSLDSPSVDDLLVIVGTADMDGRGGTLARAGYCHLRADNTPIIGQIVFDEDDISRWSSGYLERITLHELGHALGFLPGYWALHDLVDNGSDPHFKGSSAIAAFNAAGGSDYTGNKVPIHAAYNGHWRESIFRNEIMTPTFRASETNPFSAITLQAMADVGYSIVISEADNFTLSLNMDLPDIAGQTIDLTDDVVMGPVMVVDSMGRILRVIPPPGGAVPPPVGDTVEVTEVVIDRREREKPEVLKRNRP